MKIRRMGLVMNNFGQVLLYVLLLLVSLAMGNWFYNNFKWVNEEQEVGFQGIAQTNHLLAAEFFLRKMGIKVQQVNGLVALRDLPSTQHTLLIATQRETINKEMSQELLKWVRAGGHLIVEARSRSVAEEEEKSSISEDHLLDEFSIYSVGNEQCGCREGSATDEEGSRDDLEEQASEQESVPVQFSLENEEKRLNVRVNFPYELTLKKTSKETLVTWSVQDDIGHYLMQIPLEQGLLTIITSTSIFDNEQIADYEHARFLHSLMQQKAHDAGVWLIRVDDMPPLWDWLWKNAWHLMASLSVLFFLWLWRAPLRFGPLMHDDVMERRSLLEHVQASGYYRWQKHQSGYLLSKVQEHLWNKIQKAHSGIRRENQKLAYAKLEDLTGIKQENLEEALSPVKEVSEQDFVKKIKMLGMIKKASLG